MAIHLNVQTDDVFEALYLFQCDEKALASVNHDIELEPGKRVTIFSFRQTDAIRKGMDVKTKTLNVEHIAAGLKKLGMEVVPKERGERPKRAAKAKAGLSPEDREKRDGVLMGLVGKAVRKQDVSDALRKAGLAPKGWAGPFAKLGGKLKD